MTTSTKSYASLDMASLSSSTWLVLLLVSAHDPGYFAMKIFTVAGSEHAKTVELPITKDSEVHKISRLGSLELPSPNISWQFLEGS